MGTTAYPGGFDTFNVPTEPESTSLSSAGSSTRDHPEWHDDAGTAIVALEHNAALKGHDHSGDTSDVHKGTKLLQANTHETPDTNVSTSSLHHTLGTNPTQAAAGNHAHDYSGGTIFNKPFFLCQSNNRPTTPAIGTMIWEQDTNRVRVWSQFAGNVLSAGLNSTDNFERTNANDLGSLLWAQTYIDMGAGAGKLAIPDGHNASWIDTGNGNYRGIARRINPADQHTQSTDQVLTWTTGPTPTEGILLFSQGAFDDFYVRMSDDQQSYVRFAFGNDAIYANYATAGPTSELPLGQISASTAVANEPFSIHAIGRSFSVYQFGSLLGVIPDNKLVTILTSNNKGWGFGMQAGARFFGQTTPGNIADITIADAVVYLSQPRWTLLPVASVPVTRLRQVATQQLATNGSILTWGGLNSVVEDTFGNFNPSDPTKITISEPGMYDIDAAVQWDPSIVPDVATVVLCINGVETTIRQQQFMKGGFGVTPGFSQTISLTGKLRCNPGDALSLKAYYTAPSGILSFIFSFFDGPTKVQSRFDIRYAGV